MYASNNDSDNEPRTVSPTPAVKAGRLPVGGSTLRDADRGWTALGSEQALEKIKGVFKKVHDTIEYNGEWAIKDTTPPPAPPSA